MKRMGTCKKMTLGCENVEHWTRQMSISSTIENALMNPKVEHILGNVLIINS